MFKTEHLFNSNPAPKSQFFQLVLDKVRGFSCVHVAQFEERQDGKWMLLVESFAHPTSESFNKVEIMIEGLKEGFNCAYPPNKPYSITYTKNVICTRRGQQIVVPKQICEKFVDYMEAHNRLEQLNNDQSIIKPWDIDVKCDQSINCPVV